jgi:uncharacterized repeat protein (TIGR01451 family)
MRIVVLAALAMAGALILAGTAAALPVPGFTELISQSSSGAQGDQDSEMPSISSDGRFVAFVSFSENLVADDTNLSADVFVRDRLLETTERVSVSSSGRQADGNSGLLNLMGGPSISGDGRFVAFSSDATNLVSGDRNSNSDVFVHDRQTGETTRVSVATDGTEANAGGTEPALSRDGRFVAFVSFSDNLAPDGNFTGDIYVHDRSTGVTELISRAHDGGNANSQSFAPTINADGRFVYYTSFASNLVEGDNEDNSVDAYLFDRQTGTTTAITFSASGFAHSSAGAISADGRFLTFTTQDTTFLTLDANGFLEDAWLVDRATGEYILVSVNDAGVQGNDSTFAGPVSDDGNFVAMVSRSTNFTGAAESRENVYVRDRAAATTRIVSVATDGTAGDFPSLQPAMTPDASVFAFMSRSSSFQPEENQSFFASDVWVRDTRAQADLSVTKTDSPDPVTARSNVTYTVTVTNSGPATATGVTLVDRLPEAVFVSATASQGSCVRGGKGRRDGTLTCDLGSLASGATATVTIVLTTSRDGTIVNTASVRANEPDGDRTDNTATEETTVLPR